MSDFISVKDAISDKYLSIDTTDIFEDRRSPSAFAAAVEQANQTVHSIGVGRKISGGQTDGELCIRFYVSEKRPMSLLSIEARLPKTIDGLPTDVIESPPVFASPAVKKSSCSANRRSRQRPMPAGISVGHPGVTSGTIGYFCTSIAAGDDPEAIFILSNNHVLANMNAGKPGDPIYQPGVSDGGTAVDQVAQLTRFEPVSFKSGARNVVDAAIAELDDRFGYRRSICSIGKVNGSIPAALKLQVVKHGRTSGFGRGIVTDISVDTVVRRLNPASPRSRAAFRDQIRIDSTTASKFGQPGDSGALVVTADRQEAIGLLLGTPPNGGYALANPIDAVLQALKIELV